GQEPRGETMRIAAVVAVAFFVSGVTTARAQERPAAEPESVEQLEYEDEGDEATEESPRPRRRIRVLQHSYDIASFYRSSPSGSPLGLGYGPAMEDGRYPIAGFYRSGPSSRGASSSFWTTGYGHHLRGGRGLIGPRRVRPLGLNGDLFLFAPTFLAPVGPLSGVFFDR
ncbi:MAG TPA: hypothetical protein VMR21_16355, partial [Vicinamibacteria bacterium]|nr:hypothetical protein [Vicinamibacteria bacterium]